MYSGFLELYPADNCVWVMLWSNEHRDAGNLMGVFDTRQEAIAYAQGFAAASLAKLDTAEIVTFQARGRAH